VVNNFYRKNIFTHGHTVVDFGEYDKEYHTWARVYSEAEPTLTQIWIEY